MLARLAMRLSLGTALAAAGALALAAPANAALECGDEIHSSKTLRSNLECDGSVDGLALEGDDITLDLNGHRISAEPNAAASTGIFVGHGTGNKVTDGKVRGFDTGVEAGESTRATLSKLDIKAEVTDVSVAESVGTRVVENVLRHGLSSPLVVAGQFTEDVKVLRNRVTNAGSAGIVLAELEGADVRSNHVDGADEAGILIQGSASDVGVVDNRVERTEGGGIVISTGAAAVKARANTVLDVNFNGFFVAGGTDVTLRANVAKRSQNGDGIHVEDADTLIEDNTVINNDQHGIESSSANGSGNVARRNGVTPQCMPEALCT